MGRGGSGGAASADFTSDKKISFVIYMILQKGVLLFWFFIDSK